MGNNIKHNDKPKYLDEVSEVSKSRTKTFLWDQIQKVLEGTVPGYRESAKGLEKSRKRMHGKDKSLFGNEE